MIAMPATYPVTCHTNFVGPGSTFVAIKGFLDNGLLYLDEAVAKGATHVVIAHDAVLTTRMQEQLKKHDVFVERVANPRQALALLSAQAAGNPAQKMKIFGVTGTKGKTTTTSLMEHMLTSQGCKTALIGSARNMINGVVLPAPLTTPQPDYLQQFLKLAFDNGVTHVVLEVAAQALSMHRIEGIMFDGVVFTNLDREHLEFYPTMEEYFAAKSMIFEYQKKKSVVLVNADDMWCKKLESEYPRFSINDKSALFYGAFIPSIDHAGIHASISHEDNAYQLYCPALLGSYNLSNIVAAVGILNLAGFEMQKLVESLSSFAGVPGRLEQYPLSNGALCVIDSAHNPLSFRAVLSTLRSMTDKLIVVFGAAGDRDPGRRPEMGAIVAQYADVVIITTDNPRTEDPGDIADQVMTGISADAMQKTSIILDRGSAIKSAIEQSNKGAIIALLGKGTEEYQIVGNSKVPFSEKRLIKEL